MKEPSSICVGIDHRAFSRADQLDSGRAVKKQLKVKFSNSIT